MDVAGGFRTFAVGITVMLAISAAAHAQEPQPTPASSAAKDEAQRKALEELKKQLEDLRKKSEATKALCEGVTLLARDLLPAVGQYQIVMRDGVRADTFLLDTHTGRVWKPFTFTSIKGEPEVWILQQRLDSEEASISWETRMLLEGRTKEPGPGE